MSQGSTDLPVRGWKAFLKDPDYRGDKSQCGLILCRDIPAMFERDRYRLIL